MAFVAVDRRGLVVSWNKQAETIFGWPRREAIGKPVVMLAVPEGRRAAFLSTIQRIRNAPQRFRAHRAVELAAIRKSGTEIPIELTISRIEAGGSDVVCGFVRDISKRRRAEQDLRDNEQRFRQLAENIREVFWITSADGQEMVYVSPAYEKVWGDRCEDLYENPHKWIQAIHEDDRERVNDAFFRDIPNGTFSETYRIVRPDNGIRWIRDRGFPVRNAAGEIYRVAGIAEDITEQKRVQQELEDKHHELLRSERLAAIGEMVAELAHESGNALQRSQACLHMLADSVGDRPRALELVGRVQEAHDHLYLSLRARAGVRCTDNPRSARRPPRRGGG